MKRDSKYSFLVGVEIVHIALEGVEIDHIALVVGVEIVQEGVEIALGVQGWVQIVLQGVGLVLVGGQLVLIGKYLNISTKFL